MPPLSELCLPPLSEQVFPRELINSESSHGLQNRMRAVRHAGEQPHGGLIFRVDAGLTFANRSSILAKLQAALRTVDLNAEAGAEYHPGVVLSCEGVNSIDLAALETLHEIHDTLGASLVAAEVKGLRERRGSQSRGELADLLAICCCRQGQHCKRPCGS